MLCSSELTYLRSIEHNDVEIVAVNDPFIEPHYAVSSHPHDTSLRSNRIAADTPLGIHAQV